jgi:hypothetical protein
MPESRFPKRLKSAVAVLLSCFVTFSLFAGPPFLADDPVPVEYRHWELCLAASYEHNKSESTGTLPQVEVNYGLLPNLQLHAIASAVLSHPVGQASAYGYGDTEAGVKYRFIEEGRYMPQIGFFPKAELPTGNSKEGLGNGKAQVFFPLWLQKSFGSWTTYGGGGYWYNPGPDNKNWVFLGWELQRDISDKLTIGGEVFYQTSDKSGVSASEGFNLGGIFNLDKNNHILCSAGSDFHGPTRVMGYLAYQLMF